jgi:TonB family protein
VTIALLEPEAPAPAPELTPIGATGPVPAPPAARRLPRVAVSFTRPSEIEALAAPEPDERAGDGFEPEPPAPAPAPAEVAAERPAPAMKAPHVAADTARALRVYDTFPKLLEQARVAQAEVIVEVCVSDHGRVNDAVIARGGSSAIDATLRAAIRSWRYRPLLVNGAPTPFCHFMRITYGMN